MVIRPQELETRVNQTYAAEMTCAEERIDETLLRSAKQYPVNIDTQVFGVLPRTLLEEVIEKYRHAGWRVQYHSDQRDGSFYSFNPITERDHSQAQYR
ncbi:MAG: hypothetical protein ABIH41_04790 [Nanoarchaeota archaeon]